MKKILLLAVLTSMAASLYAQDHDYQLVVTSSSGEIVKYELQAGSVENIYGTTISTDWLSGWYDDPWAEYPDLPIYFEIDGKHYGPADDMTSASEAPYILPLHENNNSFSLPAGFGHEAYNIGVEIDTVTDSYKMIAVFAFAHDWPIQAPSITYRTTNDAIIISATCSEGYIRMMVNGEIVDNPCTIARGAEDSTITVTAIAREFYKPQSEPATLEITVPARDVAHDTGHWLVLIDKDGNEVWKELVKQSGLDYDFYLTNVTLEYETYSNGWGPGSVYRLAYFNFAIDGIRYGAEENLLPIILGMVIENPLYPNNNFYTVPAGYSYRFGVCYSPYDGNMYADASIGWNDVDEMSTDGKIVSNVRYYNIMGQEMQEANGLTIVVTTYTDGSHSAVKVIK
jgi:hypothetical protein